MPVQMGVAGSGRVTRRFGWGAVLGAALLIVTGCTTSSPGSPGIAGAPVANSARVSSAPTPGTPLTGAEVETSSPTGQGSAGSAESGQGTRSAASARAWKLPAGSPVVVVSLGDSLTAGQGEDSERGYPARLEEALAENGHPGATALNLGRSGWDSGQVINGDQGDSGQLAPALDAIGVAKQEGKPVIATLLIGSNDLWHLYDSETETTAADERDNLERYEQNVERVVRELRGAGAYLILGINDDQSKRPVIADPSIRVNNFPGITDAEAQRMSAQAGRYAEVVRKIAADNGALVADFFRAPFFADPARLNEDGMHPNARGYDEMAQMWLEAMRPSL